MSTVLDAIIARGFNLNQPEFGTRFVNAQNNRQIIDSNLQGAQTRDRINQFNLGQAQQTAADERAVGELFSQFQNTPSEVQQGAEQRLANFDASAARGGVNPALRDQAVQMLTERGIEGIGERQQQLLAKMAERDPQLRDLMLQQYMAPPPAPSTTVGKLMAERDQIARANPTDPRIATYDAAIAKANTPSGVNVTVEGAQPPVQQKAEDKAYGESMVADYNNVLTVADAAQENLSQLEIMRAIPVETGASEGLKAGIGNLAAGLGLPVSDEMLAQVTNAQSFNSIAGNLLAAKLASQKGPQTDEDARRMKQTLAQMSNVPAANDFIIRSSIALETRKIQMAEFARNWKESGRSFEGWRSAWSQYTRETPLMGVNEKTGLPVFFTEFMDVMSKANPDASQDELETMWREKYGR